MSFQDKLSALLSKRVTFDNAPRAQMIRDAVTHREAIPAACGALATWTPPESSGRSPKDTYIVRNPESEDTIDWNAPNNIPLAPDTFDMVLEDSLATLENKALFTQGFYDEMMYFCQCVLTGESAKRGSLEFALRPGDRSSGESTTSSRRPGVDRIFRICACNYTLNRQESHRCTHPTAGLHAAPRAEAHRQR